MLFYKFMLNTCADELENLITVNEKVKCIKH